MKYARILNNIALEVIDFDPSGKFHPDVAAQFELVPDDVNQQATRNSDGEWTAYVAPPYVEPPPYVPPVVVDQHEWHIYPGAFKSRLGMDAVAIGASNDEVCRGVASSLSDRLYVDLKGMEASLLLDILIANNQPTANPKFPGSGPITPAKKLALLTTPVPPKDRYRG